MTERSKSILFLMEQLFVIVVFAVCAAVCVKIFAASYQMTKETGELNNAVIAAAGGAEAYKASVDGKQAAELLNGEYSDGLVKVYYDGAWLPCGKASAEYIMRLSYGSPDEAGGQAGGQASGHLIYGDISVGKATGEEIVAITAAVRRNGL